MGCFLSTNSAAPPPKTPRTPNSAASAQYNAGSKSPPPADEETVKQVLSETPAISKRPPPPAPRIFLGSNGMLHQNGGAAKKPAAAFGNDEPSDVDSEIRSTHSESYSTGSDGALRWPRLNNRQFPGVMKREKTAGRSPARRSDTSPSRVKHGSGYSRKTGGGDSLGRRSRSPVIRWDSGSSKTGGKSSRKTGNQPGHVGFGSGGPGEPPTSNELLESSLVSLECFIFL